MRAFACDLYRDENAFQRGQPRGKLLTQPVEEAYGLCADADEGGASWQLFPMDRPLELSGRRVTSTPLEPTDVTIMELR